MTPGAAARIPTTLFARLVALVAFIMLLTQLVGGLVFFLLKPPPGMLLTHVSEIAEALKAEASKGPDPTAAPAPASNRARLRALEPLLAERLGVATRDVRVWREGPRPPPLGPEDTTVIDPVVMGGYGAALRVDGGWVAVERRPVQILDVITRMGVWLVVSLILIAPVAILLGARVTSPISAFAEQADRLGRDPYAPPMRYAGPAEVLLAVQAFNEMQGRLRAYIDDRVRMVGAIAHDLRTPLTRLRLQIQGLAPGPRARAEAEIERMQRMVEGALTFVKDASSTAERVPLHLLSLVEAVADDLSQDRAPAIVEDGPDPIVVADEVALRRALNNLISNALLHGGDARCRVVVEETQAVIQIDDTGPGLAEDDLDRVFQPYVRLAAEETGIGLGLSIVRTIARAHGGEARLTNRPEGGLRAEVRIPLPPVRT